MAVMADFYGNVEFSSRASTKGQSRTVLGSDFEYRNSEFTSQAIGNRQKRQQRITPIMKWEFLKDTHKMMANIRTMKPVVDSGPPKRRNVAQSRRYREEHEQIRLDGIEKENHEMLDRLRKIHNRPRSTFCYLKRRGEPLVKGDAFRLPPPTAKGNYLVEMYKKLKLSNPVISRKSIRIQQEMLTSAIDVVKASNKNEPTQETIETEVQSTLSKEDEVLPEPVPEPEPLSPVEIVQQVAPEIDAKVLDELVAALAPMPQPEPGVGVEQPVDTNQTGIVEASQTQPSSDAPQSTTGEAPTATPAETPGGTAQSMDISPTPTSQEASEEPTPPNLLESWPFD
ncbi:unnamed protein product [Calypogeia fissa]